MTPDGLVDQPSSRQEIEDLLRRYLTARADADVGAQSVDGRYVDAYTAAFLLAKIVVRASGYRVKTGDNHRDTLLAVPWLMGSDIQPTVDAIEAARRRRNSALYDAVGMVDERDVEALLARVDAFERDVRAWLREQHQL